MTATFRLHGVATGRDDDTLIAGGKFRGDERSEVFGAFGQSAIFRPRFRRWLFIFALAASRQGQK